MKESGNMKTMKNMFAMAFMAVVGLAGCQQELIDPNAVESDALKVYATIEDADDTKTSLNDREVYWSSGDRIAVFMKNTLRKRFDVSSESVGTKDGTFLYDTDYIASGKSVAISNNLAYYPFAEVTCTPGGGSYSLENLSLPSTQNYSPSSFGQGAFPMVAVTTNTDDLDFAFKNLCGVLAFQLKGSGTVKSITVKGNSNEILSGKATVKASYGKNPEISLLPNGGKTVTLDCGETGVALQNDAPTFFYIVLPPVAFDNGFTVTVADASGATKEYSTTKKNTILRSSILRMPEKEYVGEKVPQEGDYVDEYGINHGQGVKIGETVWAPVNCGYHATNFKYGKLYQWGRKYGQGYSGYLFDVDGYGVGTHSDSSVPTIEEGPVSLEYGQIEGTSNVFFTSSSNFLYDWLSTQDDKLWNNGTESAPVKTEYDPCPDGWRVPTYAELKGLISNRSTMTSVDGQNGYWFSGASTYTSDVPQVFFPATGLRDCSDGAKANNRGYDGYYWASRPSDGSYACTLLLDNSSASIYLVIRAYGFSVRCVQDDAILIPVENIRLSKSTLTLSDGASETLSSTITPSNANHQTAHWWSDNPEVATVDQNGTVTAVMAGVATIYAKAGTQVATCEVTVNSQTTEDKITIYEANDYVISFSSANAWTASTDCDWITISPKSGTSGNNSISVQLSKNDSTAERTGNVTITSGTASAKISYTQDGATNSSGDGGNANPDDCNKISLKVDMSATFNYNWSDAEWEDYLNKSYTSVNMTGYGADYKCIEYSDEWITICFNGNVTTIPGVLPYASYAETIVLPNSVINIGDNAFANHNKCNAINIPSSLQTIGKEAFAYVTCLKDLVLPESVVSIGQGAFFGCTNMTSVTIPSSLRKISTQAFSFSGLTEISIPSSIQKIEALSFQSCTNLKKVTIGNNSLVATMEIEQNVFENCSSLTDAIIGSEVDIIGEEAFSRCTSLQSIKIPGAVSIVNTSAFAGCTGLKYLEIGDSKTSHNTIIRNQAFENCSSLIKTTLNKSVLIEDDYSYHYCFANCTGDLDIYCSIPDYSGYSPFEHSNFDVIRFLDGVEKIGNNALKDVVCKSIHLNAGIREIGDDAFRLAECEFINCEEFYQLTSIGRDAFTSHKLNNLYLPKSLKTIGHGAFVQCNINSDITLYSGVTVGTSAFHSANLETITIQDGVSFEQQDVTDSQFDSCSGILITHCQLPVYESGYSPFHLHKFSSITIGDNVTRINSGEYLTSYDSTNNITIGKNVTYIGYNAFGCRNLKVVYCKPQTPPALEYTYYTIFPENTTVYVPRQSVDLYKNTSGWKYHSDYITGYDF